MLFTDEDRAAVAAACTVLHVTLMVAPEFSILIKQPSVTLSADPGAVAPVRSEAAPHRQLGGVPGTREKRRACTHKHYITSHHITSHHAMDAPT